MASPGLAVTGGGDILSSVVEPGEEDIGRLSLIEWTPSSLPPSGALSSTGEDGITGDSGRRISAGCTDGVPHLDDDSMGDGGKATATKHIKQHMLVERQQTRYIRYIVGGLDSKTVEEADSQTYS